MTIYVPQRFASSVLDHVVMNLAMAENYPLIMGIFGLPGEGKSFQLRFTLQSSNVEILTVSAADLESDRAGQPGKELQATYVQASRSIEAGTPAAVVIDDIDTTVGEWENNTGTVNHQQVLAELMHLADRPCFVQRIGSIRRVPLFMTGNDFGKIYPPLRRPQRMLPMHWRSTPVERVQMLKQILGDEQSDIANELVDAYPEQSISFFAQVNQMTQLRLAGPVLQRLRTDLTSVARDPSRYQRYLSTAGVDASLFRQAFEEAAKELARDGRLATTSWLGDASA